MSWRNKVIIGISFIVIISVLLLIIKFQHDEINKLNILKKSIKEQKQLSNKTIRAKSSLVSNKNFNKIIKNNDINKREIEKDLNTKIKGISKVKIKTKGYNVSNIPSSKVTKNLNPTINEDKYNYLLNRQVLNLNEPFIDNKIPFGEVGFSAWKATPWDLKIKKREYNLTNILTQDEDGRHYIYNKFNIVVDNKKYDVKINKANFVEKLPEAKFRFNPRLYLGLHSGAYVTKPNFALIPNLQVVLFSYGNTKPDSDWVFLGAGLGYESINRELNFNIVPVGYNVGHNLPLVNNIFISPIISADLKGNIIISFGIQVGL